MIWDVLAVGAGLCIGSTVNMGLIMLNSKVLYPMPKGVSMKDTEQFQAYIDSLPAPAFLVVMAAHLSQAFVGGLAAAWFGTASAVTLALVVGGISMLGGIMMMRTIKGPKWMLIELPLYLVVAYAAGILVEGMRAAG